MSSYIQVRVARRSGRNMTFSNICKCEGGDSKIPMCDFTATLHNLIAQRKRTSQAMEAALVAVVEAERAAQSDTVKHQLRFNGDGSKDTQERIWT